MDFKSIGKCLLMLLLAGAVGCSSKLTREQTLAYENTRAEQLLEENIATDELFDDSKIDQTKAIVIAKVFTFGRNNINGIPTTERLSSSGLLFTNHIDSDVEFLASGPSYHVYQVPLGEYYLSRVVAGQSIAVLRDTRFIRYNYIKGSALDENDQAQYGSIELQGGEVYYLGDIQTYGTAPGNILYPNFRSTDNQEEMRKYVTAHFPSLVDRIKTQLFVVQNPDKATKAALAGIEPEREKVKRLAREQELNKPFSLAGESQQHIGESAAYIKRLKSTENRIVLYKEIYNSWLNDPQLFDVIKDQAMSYAHEYTKPNAKTSETHWAFKALASSGLQRYKATFEAIENIPGSSKLVRQAAKYKKLLDARTLLARDVHSDKFLNTELSWQTQHAANMIESSDIKTKILGTKLILKNGVYKKTLLDHITKVLLISVKSPAFNRHTRTIQLNLMKALARCKDINYKSVLEKVMAITTDDKVRDYAEAYIDYLEDSIDK